MNLGITTTMHKYDYNIYGPSADVLTISAYPQRFDFEQGYVVTDYSEKNSYTLTLNYPEDYEDIAYLFDRDDLEELRAEWSVDGINGFTDFDEWPTLEFLTQGKTPAKISEWLRSLPDYDVEEEN